MATIRYLSSFNSENFIYLAWIGVELRFVEDTHHRSPGPRRWVMSVLLFTQRPYLSSQITRAQAKETNAGIALTTCRFILNNKSYMRDMVSPSHLKLWQWTCPETCAYSIMIYHTQNSSNYLITSLWLWEDMHGVLYRNLNNVMLSITNQVIFICFTIFHSVEFWRCSCGTRLH